MTDPAPYTFTDMQGRDYPVIALALESRDNSETTHVGGHSIIKTLKPARSTYGDIVTPKPCFPIPFGMGPDTPIQGVLHGGRVRVECVLFCVRPAPDGNLAYHFIDSRTYDALGGAGGRGTEWPVPTLPYVPIDRVPSPKAMKVFEDGKVRIKESDN